MIAIYCLESPSGKIYIGQTWNLEKRMAYYRTINCKGQPGIYKSLKKYGFKAHKVSVLNSLPSDISQSTLDTYEQVYISQFKDAGYILLNMKDGGSGGKLSEEAIEKIKHKRSLQCPPMLGRKRSAEFCERMREVMTGRKIDPEVVKRVANKNRGRKATPETIEKLKACRSGQKNWWKGKKHSSSAKEKMALAKVGNKINNKEVVIVDTGEVFPSLTDAALSIGVPMKTLSARIKANSQKKPIIKFRV